jgi:ATP-dependent helicase/nuclease subunit B
VCGFRYFAKRLLKLEALKEPEEGMDAAQRGTLNHEILEKTYAHFRRQGMTITPDNVEDALQTLRRIAYDVFRTGPEKIGFRADALWVQEQAILLRKLELLVWTDFSADSPINRKFGQVPRIPYQLEAPFGMDEDNSVTIALDDGEALRVRGYIDRIDRAENRAIIIDYKTGSTTIPISEISEGRNFQMMLYALAADTLLKSDPDAPAEVAGGLFWHVSNSKTSGDLHLEDSAGQDAIEQGRAHLTRYLAQGRAGDFATHANKLQEGKCVRYCEFSQLCRVSIMSRKKRD